MNRSANRQNFPRLGKDRKEIEEVPKFERVSCVSVVSENGRRTHRKIQHASYAWFVSKPCNMIDYNALLLVQSCNRRNFVGLAEVRN